MSRTKRPIGSPSNLALSVAAGLVTTLLAATSTPYAQNAAPGPAQQSANPSPPAPAASTAAAADPAQAPAAQPNAGGKQDPVCFKLTGRCVETGKTSAAKGGTAGPVKGSSTGKKPLNLTAPDVRTVVPENDLKEPLPSTDQVTETQESETVSVKGDQGVPPDVPGGFGAIWWAVNHPSQAWRILAPAE